MPAPRLLARMNRRVTNHIMEPIALRLPGFGVVIHKGRKSRRSYRTPVNVFRLPDAFVVPLIYGSDSEWVQNVLTAGSCQIKTCGLTWTLTEPRIQHDPEHSAVPRVIGFFLELLNVNDFLELRVEERGEDAVKM